MAGLNLIIVSDIHQSSGVMPEATGIVPPVPGIELLKRVVRRIRAGKDADALILLGDLLNNGDSPDADANFAALRDMAKTAGVPVIAVPGNHDKNPERFFSTFGDSPGPHEIKGAILYSFADTYSEGDVCRRSDEALDRLVKYAAANRGKPIIALQHNPVHPPIESDYPYNLANGDMVMRAYGAAGVTLSLSGHFHAGQPLTQSSGTYYATCPALCDHPFRYTRIKLEDGAVSAKFESLANDPAMELCDVHIHTQYAYCGHGIDALTAIERARLFGLGRMSLTEHSDQLYLTREDFTAKKIFTDPSIPRRMREAGADRMIGYRRFAGGLRSDFVRLGLEIECNSLFEPILLEEDREGWDVIIAGIHWITDEMISRAGGLDKGFMRMVESLLNGGASVLAHPFRFFNRNGMERPRHLYRPLARMLAERGVAAEVNYHTNTPDPAFFAMCLEEGVRIAFGSDSHAPYEAGELGLHMNLLRRIGVSDKDLPKILYRLP